MRQGHLLTMMAEAWGVLKKCGLKGAGSFRWQESQPAAHPAAGGSAGSLGSGVWYQLRLEVWQVSEIGSSTVFWKA